MEKISFFKLQSKNLLKDFKSRVYNESEGFYEYHPTHFDIGDLFLYFEFPDDEEGFTFTLMSAQHLIAKMVGFEKWENLIHATPSELELAEFLLRRFKNSQDIQDWEETLSLSGVAEYGAETVLEYARQYYELGDKKKIVNLSQDKVTVLKGKQRQDALIQFDDEHNPDGLLRLDSLVHCSCCYDAFPFRKSKVIRNNENNLTMVVCKNYPNCKGTYLDYNVLSPTFFHGDVKNEILKKEGSESFPRLDLDSKVRCLHCDEEYKYEDANVVQLPGDQSPHICCKNYPECDGSFMDLIKVENN